LHTLTLCARRIVNLLIATGAKWWSDNPWRLSAALSYYTLFSLAPLLTIAVAVAAVVAEENAVQEALLGRFATLVGTAGADSLAAMLHSAQKPSHGAMATLISLVMLVVVSMGMFSELQDALNFIWRIPGKPRPALWGAVRTRLVSFALVIGTGFLLLVSLILDAALAGVGTFLQHTVPAPRLIVKVVELLGSPIAISLLFALMFKVLPEGHIAWRDVWMGAIATALLFTTGKWMIGLYLGGTAMASMYGAAASLMAILVWVYYSAAIFFLGAEFTCVYAYAYGSRRTDR
jgi:membrane protein